MLTKEFKKKFSENIKDTKKKYIKAENYKEFKKSIKKAYDALELYRKTIDGIDSSIGSAIIGIVIGACITTGRQIMLLPVGILTAGIALTIKEKRDCRYYRRISRDAKSVKEKR